MAKEKLKEESREISVKVYFDEKDTLFDVKDKIQKK